MANVITVIRIVCSIILLFCRPLSPWFNALYITAGISDIFDGIIARQTNTASELGSKLDTIADFVFTAVCLVKLIPVLEFRPWMYVWVAAIAAIKIVNIISGYLIQKKMIAVHSVMNKITGVLLFLLPLSLNYVDFRYSVVIACSVATFAAIQEGHLIRTWAT